jgi:hypothetical protein
MSVDGNAFVTDKLCLTNSMVSEIPNLAISNTAFKIMSVSKDVCISFELDYQLQEENTISITSPQELLASTYFLKQATRG